MITATPEKLREVASEYGKMLLENVGVNMAGPHFCNSLFNWHYEQITTGGVRAGKSTGGAAKIILDIAYHQFMAHDDLLYWIIGPDYLQTHQEFGYIQKWLSKLGSAEEVQVQASTPQDGTRRMEAKILSNNAQGRYTMKVVIETKSAMHTQRLGSVAPDGILVVEAGQCPEEIRATCIERASEKGAWIAYTGTMEIKEGRTYYPWFTELATKWQDEMSPLTAAYSLPSWENRELYGNCLSQITNSPALAYYCPDANHGPAHSGYLHPVIQHAKANLADRDFRMRFGGEPQGVPYLVYPQLQDESKYLKPLPAGLAWYTATGGMDYGTVHPSTLVVVSFARDLGGAPGEPSGVGWVREAWANDGNDPGDTHLLQAKKLELSRKYECWRWGVDPQQTYAAKNDAWATTVSGSAGSREYRIGLTATRLNWSRLFFDVNGAGVRQLFDEMKLVHRFKTRDGELKIHRDKDDRTAAVENAIETMDGLVRPKPPTPGKMKNLPPSRKFRRVMG